MSKAIVTFEDDDNNQVKVHIDFGEGGGEETSPAHHMAMAAVQAAMRQFGSADEGEVE